MHTKEHHSSVSNAVIGSNSNLIDGEHVMLLLGWQEKRAVNGFEAGREKPLCCGEALNYMFVHFIMQTL